MTKEHFQNEAKKYIANAKTLDSLNADQVKAINELKKTLEHVVRMSRSICVRRWQVRARLSFIK